MTSLKQVDANRRNAQRSTGPRTAEGKGSSRLNAIRHGLTAQTVIPAFESSADYRCFEKGIAEAYRPRTAVHAELVARLASLLWRLRRAATIETGLFQIQAEILRDLRSSNDTPPNSEVPNLGLAIPFLDPGLVPSIDHDAIRASERNRPRATWRTMTHCFMRLNNVDSLVFERLGRYEAALWRQTLQLVLALKAIERR